MPLARQNGCHPARIGIDRALPGIVNACYTLLVTTGDGSVVWQESDVCADQYGDDQGSISYVGTCDASEATNFVELVLQDLWDDPAIDASPLSTPVDYVNPCTGEGGGGPRCVLEVPCNENADSEVTFNLTVMRAARQGFFDIAVNFEDLFCSAKFDTCSANAQGVADPARPIVLLHDPATGLRARTAVLGFACTAGVNASADPAERTHLYGSPLGIFCNAAGFTAAELAAPLADSGYTPHIMIDPAAGDGGQLFSEAIQSPYPGLFQASVYEGQEELECPDGDGTASCDKAYWNVALGLDGSAFPAGQTCVLQWLGAASSGPLDEGALPPATAYPVLFLSTVLITPDSAPDSERIVCQVNALDHEDSNLTTVYAPMADAGSTLTFSSELTMVGGAVDTHTVSRRFLSYEEPSLHALLLEIDPDYGRVSPVEQSEINKLETWADINAAYARNPEGPQPRLPLVSFTSSNVRAAYGYYLSSLFSSIAVQRSSRPR